MRTPSPRCSGTRTSGTSCCTCTWPAYMVTGFVLAGVYAVGRLRGRWGRYERTALTGRTRSASSPSLRSSSSPFSPPPPLKPPRSTKPRAGPDGTDRRTADNARASRPSPDCTPGGAARLRHMVAHERISAIGPRSIPVRNARFPICPDRNRSPTRWRQRVGRVRCGAGSRERSWRRGCVAAHAVGGDQADPDARATGRREALRTRAVRCAPHRAWPHGRPSVRSGRWT